MAKDNKESQPEDASTKPKRRVLRAAPEPETMRQRSEQAQAKSSQQSKLGKPLRIVAKPFAALGRLLVKVFKPLGRFKLFRAIGYVLVPPYFRNAFKELQQVTWPNARRTWQLTYAVIIFSLIFGLIVAGVDWVLDRLFREYIL